MRILIFICSIGNLFFQGFVFMKIWNWFPHEILIVPSITFAGALGLLLVIRFSRNIIFEDNHTKEEVLSRAITVTAVYGVTLLLGFIIQFFI